MHSPAPSTLGWRVVFVVLAAGAAWCGSSAPHGAPAAPGIKEVALPPAPVLTPQEAKQTFVMAPGIEVAAIAAEPVVQAPVMATFDEDGRLWVVEMRAYMPDVKATGEDLPTNRISVLEDRDGDGEFETSTVFLDGVTLPRAIAPSYGGALLLEPPNLYFCKDTDGDGKADVKRKLLDGFGGLENPEHAGNGVMWGLDNWHHLSQHKLEVKFDGEKIVTRPTPTHGQWGITQDDWGRLYYTPNPSPLLNDFFPKHLAVRNPYLAQVPGMGELIAKDASVWPAHATPGVNRGYMKGVLREDGTLANHTAACGPTILRSGLFGEEWRGNALVCEPAGNLIKRLILREKDGLPEAVNAYEGRELLASTDERFRPVWATNGPDGCVYVCDMYRGVIQHKMFLTEYLEKHAKARKLETPLNMGRIWRISPPGFKPHAMPRLSVLSNDLLVELLSHPDGWQRDTAQRLLVERRAVGAAGALRTMLQASPDWKARLHALWTLEGLGLLTGDDLIVAARSGERPLQAAALQLSEQPVRLGESAEYRRVVRGALGGTNDMPLVLMLAATARDGDSSTTGGAESMLLKRGGNKYVRAAALSTLTDASANVSMLGSMLANASWPKSAADRAVLTDLLRCVFRAPAATRLRGVELLAPILDQNDSRAEAVIACLADATGIEGERAKPIGLSGEPAQWLAAAAGKGDQAKRMASMAEYFDWPNRPPAKRAKAARSLTVGEQAMFEKGAAIFAKCAVCHQETGQGSPGQAPPLAASKIVLGNPEAPIKIVLHGLEGEYPFGDITYRGSMPGSQLETDEQIAAVLTYIRRAWDNTGDPVDTATVSRVRTETRGRNKPWTREEIGYGK
ncbi:MAG: c-type cytochrome [Planctomycetes bacterium]|nr:c-type cytochrome [Planctomycetota bacterium]